MKRPRVFFQVNSGGESGSSTRLYGFRVRTIIPIHPPHSFNFLAGQLLGQILG